MRYLLGFLLYFGILPTAFNQVVINEVMHAPGPSLSQNQGLRRKEYVEIYNTSCSPVDISCWIIGSSMYGGLGNYIGAFQFPSGTIIGPRQHLVIGGSQVQSGAAYAAGTIDFDVNNYVGSYVCDPNSNWLFPNSIGMVGMYNNTGQVVDAIYWGSNANVINTDTDFNSNLHPCDPSGGANTCPNISGDLKNAYEIYTTNPALIPYVGSGTGNGLTFSRSPDGGSWVRNKPPTVEGSNCNDGTCASTPPANTAFSYTAPACGNVTATPTTPAGFTTGGTFTAPTGVTINSTTGVIDLSASTPGGPYTITYTVTGGGCSAAGTGTTTITVPACCSVGPPSSTPTLCINTAISPTITHNTVGAIGIGTATNLPTGVTATWNSNTIKIDGTPTQTGTFNYTIPLTGSGCTGKNATGTVTVSSGYTVTQPGISTLCVNSPLTSIVHTTTGATGIGTATNLPAGVSASFAGNATSGTITINGTPSVSGTFNYSIPLTGGCGTANAIGEIRVNALPTVTVADVQVCTGLSATITAVPSPASNYTYSWTVPTGVTNPGNVSSFTTNTTGPYSVEITETSTNCKATASGTLSNNNTITPSFTQINPICLNSTPPTLPTTSNNGISGAWTPPNIDASSPGQKTYNFNPDPNPNGCNTTPTSMTITIEQLPTVSVNSPQVCAGTNATVTAIPNPSGTNYNYSWTVPTGVANPGDVASFNTIEPGNYSVVITNTTTNCISSSQTGVVSTTTVQTPTFNPVPSFCIGTPAPVLPSSSNEGISGTWSPSSVSNTSSGTYVFTANPAAGSCYQTANLTITVNTQLTVPQFDALPSLCLNATPPLLSNVSKNGITGTWTPSTVSTTQNGTYTFSPDPGQCASDAALNYQVAPNPEADFALSPNAISIFDKEFEVINISSSDAESYLWIMPDGKIDDITIKNPDFDLDTEEPGSYPITLVVKNAAGCTDSVTKFLELYDDIIIFSPNAFTPDGDEFNNDWRIYINNADPDFFDLKIYNRWGQVVFESNDPNVEWDASYAGFFVPEGCYTWTLRLKDKRTDKIYSYQGHVFKLK